MKKPSYLLFVLIFLMLATCETYHLYSEKKKEAIYDNLSEEPFKIDQWLKQLVETKTSSEMEVKRQDVIGLPIELNSIQFFNITFTRFLCRVTAPKS